MKSTYKIIFHIDLNAFFISVEYIRDPSLKNKAVAVGPDPKYLKGVISTCSYEARAFGVHSAMPVSQAIRKCPHLKIVESHFDLYHKYSKHFFELLEEYTDLIEGASIDEAYLDLTELSKTEDILDVAKDIQQRLLDEYQLPCSIGIAPNKFLAKMASDMKKPLGITVLRRREIDKLLWPLDISEMHGIGKKTYPKLRIIGINTIGDLANYEDKKRLRKVLGNGLEYFVNLANGIGSSDVDPNREPENLSIGNSRTFSKDLIQDFEIRAKLKKVTKLVTDRLKEKELCAKTFSIQIRYNDFKQITRSKTLDKYIYEFEDVYYEIEDLFEINWNNKPIRLLGVSCTNIIDLKDNVIQLDIFTEFDEDMENDEKLLRLMNNINEKYDKDIIKKGVK